VLGARLLDRIGKGMRGAPRDALIAEVTPEPVMGAAYGLRQSLDAAGAFVGPALATVLLLFFALDYRTLFWAALIPGACCLLLIVLGVREPEIHLSGRRPVPLPWRELLTIRSRAFHGVVIVGILFSLARFSNAFIVLRAADVGITPSLIPLVMVAMNAVFSLASYPFGRLADKVSAEMLLGVGLLLLIVSDAVFAWVPTPAGVLSGVALWGLHLGATQGLFAVLIARSAPQDRKATAFGVFNFFSGLAMLASGLIAGVLWQFAGAQASFAGGAVFAAACLLSIRFVRL
ncbi:MAG: MFS transporter, partial [Duodenibacillus sp.]